MLKAALQTDKGADVDHAREEVHETRENSVDLYGYCNSVLRILGTRRTGVS